MKRTPPNGLSSFRIWKKRKEIASNLKSLIFITTLAFTLLITTSNYAFLKKNDRSELVFTQKTKSIDIENDSLPLKPFSDNSKTWTTKNGYNWAGWELQEKQLQKTNYIFDNGSSEQYNTTYVNLQTSGNVLASYISNKTKNQQVTANTNPTNGTVKFFEDGTYLYIPKKDFVGIDSFQFTVCDINNSNDCTTGTVSVIINDYNNFSRNIQAKNNKELECNTAESFVNGEYFDNVQVTTPNFPLGLFPPCLGTIVNANNVIGSDEAAANIVMTGVGCLASISVKDTDDSFSAGTYAGFEVGSIELISASVFATITVKTYLNGVQQESKVVSSDLISADVFLISPDERITLGYVASKEFDEVRIEYFSLVGALYTAQVYRAVIKKFCPGETLECNEPTRMKNPEHSVVINSENTGISGLACVGCSVNNAEDVISSDDDAYATINMLASIGVMGSIAVEDVLNEYPAGTFAGFDISNPSIIDFDVAAWVTIRTFLNGVSQESSTSGSLASVNIPILNGSGRKVLGFATTKPFDQVKLEIVNLASVLNTTRVYGAIFQTFCEGEELLCNTPTTLSTPTYPVVINSERTGVNSLACVGCSLNNTQDAIDNDETTYAQMILGVSVLAEASISIKNQITNYPTGTFAGFDIENQTLISANVIDTYRVCTYLDGVLQECKIGGTQLVTVGSGLIASNNRNTIGFVANKPFDEVQFSVINLAGIDIGELKIYGMVVQEFCEVTLECGNTYSLSTPKFPVVIDNANSGIAGIACVGCSVNNTKNIVSEDVTDYAEITMLAGVLSSGSIAVTDGISTYPSGSSAGFTVSSPNTLLQLDVLGSITICTSLDGVRQECRTGLGLIDLSAIFSIIGLPNTATFVGFKTSLPYDSIQISVASLASVLNIIRVHSAFIDTNGTEIEGVLCLDYCDASISGNTDTDNDGISDVCDKDDDNDGILDIDEGTGDIDNDGIPNQLDLDSDNDGIFDIVENGGLDEDGDGRIGTGNPIDTDKDGVPDLIDPDNGGTNIPIKDSDNDGVPNYLDLDSDNDGITDVIESGGLDPDKDGVIGSGPITDTDNDGLADNVDTDNGGTPLIIIDTDKDDIPNSQDLDSDNDGTTDLIEAGGIDIDGNGVLDVLIDSDNDGLADIVDPENNTTTNLNDGTGTPLPNPDTDNDGYPDLIDLDSDNDGITDVLENGGLDPDGDGMVGTGLISDQDNDGLSDIVDTDNNLTSTANDGSGLALPNNDADNDGIRNARDLDADNDGIPDNIESQSTVDYIAPSGLDSDNDGLDNAYDKNTDNTGLLGIIPVKTDNAASSNSDNLPDYLDLDSDGDGIFDIIESGSNLTNNGFGKVTGNVGLNGLVDAIETGGIDLGYIDINGSYDTTQVDNFTDTDNDASSVGDVDYRDVELNGIPMITQVYQFGSEKWIEITNNSKLYPIGKDLIKVQFYKNKTGDQTSILPDKIITINTSLEAGKSILISNTSNSITNIDDAATIIIDNDFTDFEGANDIITLSPKNNRNSYRLKYDVIEAFKNKTSYVRVDEKLSPNKDFTLSDWVLFIDDALDPYLLKNLTDNTGGPERHPHDPLISEVNNAINTTNTLLGKHHFDKTIRMNYTWSNGSPDRSRFVHIAENHNHTNGKLSARKLKVDNSKKLSITDNLLVVTNDIELNGQIRLITPNSNSESQLIQTHNNASLVSGSGKLLVDQNSNVPSVYRYNYIGSPVVSNQGSSTFAIKDIFKDGTVPTNHSGIVNTDIARDINFISGFDGNTSSPISLAEYWMFTNSPIGGNPSTWSQQLSTGQISNTDGFIFKGPGIEQNYTFLGSPNDGLLTTSIRKDEEYLMANPYSSAISVKNFIEDNANSITGTLYFWQHASELSSSSNTSDGHNFAGYIGGYATRTITMGVSAKNAARGPINANLEAENATINGGIIETVNDNTQNIDVVKLNAPGHKIIFNEIISGVDTLRVRYKSNSSKTIRIKENNNFRTDAVLPATGDNFTIKQIVICVLDDKNITLESLDSNEIQIDYLNLTDNGNISCAPSTSVDGFDYTKPEPYIAIGQGFFVIGDDTDGGDIVFKNSQREYKKEALGESVFLRSNENQTNSINNISTIKLGMNFDSDISNSKYHRQIGLSFNKYHSFEHDKGYDAEINDIGTSDFYWKFPSNASKYVIAGIQEITEDLEVPLEIKIGISGSISIGIDELNNINSKIYIVDKLTNNSYNITESDAVIHLNEGTYSDRFILAFSEHKALSIENNISKKETNIYVDNKNKKIVISKEENIDLNTVKVYNVIGKKIISWEIKEQKTKYFLDVNKQLSNGIYFVVIDTNKGKYNKKIIIE